MALQKLLDRDTSVRAFDFVAEIATEYCHRQLFASTNCAMGLQSAFSFA
jgi:hypothetical protein